MIRKCFTMVLRRVMQAAPIVMVLACVLLYLVFFRGVTVEKILEYTPENLWLAALLMIGLFALKSLSIFFPMLILIAAVGCIFPSFWAAVLVNSIGVFVMLLIPYAIGRFAEREFVEGFIAKHKNAAKLREFKSDNELFLSYFLRVINVLPCDVVSMFFGSTSTDFRKYMLGSFLGTFPGIITTTLMGASVNDMTSPTFWISLGAEVLLAAGSGIWYYFYKKRQNKTGSD